MVKKFSVEELTKRIKQRNVITRQSVLNESKTHTVHTWIRIANNG